MRLPELTADNRRLLRTLALGQAISLLVAGTGVFSGLLAERGVSIPTAQSSLNYWLLVLVYGGYRVVRAHKAGAGGWASALTAGLAPSVPWWRYAFLAACDVEANYLVVKAYAYTSVTSIMLIDCWSIVVAMGLSAYFLRRRFGWRHGAGVALCVAGLVVLAASDAGVGSGDGGSGGGSVNATLSSPLALDAWLPGDAAAPDAGGSSSGGAPAADLVAADGLSAWLGAAGSRSRLLLLRGGGGSGGSKSPSLAPSSFGRALLTDDSAGSGPPNPLLGDVLVLGAATLYAVSNVGQEALLHGTGGSGGSTADRSEFLALLGGWGTAFNTVQLLALERGELGAALGGDGSSSSGGAVAGLMLGFAGCLFAMYSLTSVFLSHCDATLFNLSLLTSDAWAILASLVLFGQPIRPLYWPALALIVCGLFVYNRAPPPTEGDDGARPAGAAAVGDGGSSDGNVGGGNTGAVMGTGGVGLGSLSRRQILHDEDDEDDAGVGGGDGGGEAAGRRASGGSGRSRRRPTLGDEVAGDTRMAPLSPSASGAATPLPLLAVQTGGSGARYEPPWPPGGLR
jgi:drug/metabolite transporter (DMT)-like permease